MNIATGVIMLIIALAGIIGAIMDENKENKY